MRSLLILLLVAAAPVAAQVRLAARAGVTVSAAIVKDQIVEDIEVVPALAPTLTIGASLPVNPKLRADLELAYATSTAEVEENGDQTGDLGGVGTLAYTVGLSGPILSRLSWRLSLGGLTYLPSEEEGIFRDGGHTTLLFGAGLDWRQPISTAWAIVAGLRYDYHTFTTDALEAQGFTQSQQVQRLGLSVGAAWDTP
jgi:hypothetical protein